VHRGRLPETRNRTHRFYRPKKTPALLIQHRRNRAIAQPGHSALGPRAVLPLQSLRYATRLRGPRRNLIQHDGIQPRYPAPHAGVMSQVKNMSDATGGEAGKWRASPEISAGLTIPKLPLFSGLRRGAPMAWSCGVLHISGNTPAHACLPFIYQRRLGSLCLRTSFASVLPGISVCYRCCIATARFR
jgi:hypothetical protein